MTTPIKNLSPDALKAVLWGDEYEHLVKASNDMLVPYYENFEGVIPFMTRFFENGAENIVKQYKDFLEVKKCPSCQGARLKEEALFFKIHDKNIAELAQFDIQELSNWFLNLEQFLEPRQLQIAGEILKEINKRISFY